MADPEVVEEGKGKKGQEAEESANKGTPKKAAAVAVNPMLIIGIGAIVVAVLGAFFLVKALSPKKPVEAKQEEKQEQKESAKEGESSKKKETSHAKKGGHGGGHGEKAGSDSPFYNFGKPIVVNIAETGGEKYLKVDLTLNMDSPELSEEIESKKPQLLDTLINILSNKTLTDINTNVGKNMLRQEMIDKLNALLETGRIVNIYFTEFVIQ